MFCYDAHLYKAFIDIVQNASEITYYELVFQLRYGFRSLRSVFGIDFIL
jgi:hypothetical protein